MRILVIISSPRKRNTYEAVKRIEDVHNSIAPCEYEYLFLKDIKLMNCTGCHVCLTRGEQFCPFRDDRRRIGDSHLFLSDVKAQRGFAASDQFCRFQFRVGSTADDALPDRDLRGQRCAN